MEDYDWFLNIYIYTIDILFTPLLYLLTHPPLFINRGFQSSQDFVRFLLATFHPMLAPLHTKRGTVLIVCWNITLRAGTFYVGSTSSEALTDPQIVI